MFENPRRGRQARNFTKNVPKILDLKSSSEQIFSENWRWVPLSCAPLMKFLKLQILENAQIFGEPNVVNEKSASCQANMSPKHSFQTVPTIWISLMRVTYVWKETSGLTGVRTLTFALTKRARCQPTTAVTVQWRHANRKFSVIIPEGGIDVT